MVKIQLKECRSEATFVEGDLIMKRIRYLKLDWLRVILFILVIPLTAGFSFLFAYWLPSLRRWMLFRYVNTIQQASHFLIVCWDDELEFVRKRKENIYNFETQESKVMICFRNRHLLYVVDETKDTCTAVEMPIYKPFSQIIEKYGSGIDEQYFKDIRCTFGDCKIDFRVPSYPTLFMKEIVSPFFVFQLYSAGIWFWEAYTVYAIVILSITSLFVAINLVMLRMSLKKIHKLAFFTTKVTYYKKNGANQTKIEDASSTELLPGSILVLKDGMKIPCDCILLQGQVLLNECSLTGESVPVTKSAAPHNKDVYNVNIHKMFTVYEGTDVLQVNKHQGEALALVIRTGFGSVRGQLVRGILYPKPHPFRFAREVYYFLLILGLITLGGFAVSIPFMIEAQFGPADFAQGILDLITISIPPALPAALTIGVGYAITRLKYKKIDCISPPKTQVAGRVDAVCFDKTGTITNDDMDLKGVRLAVNGRFGSFLETRKDGAKISAEETAVLDILNLAAATCHDIAVVDTIVAGDPMEIKLVEYTGLKYHTSESRDMLFVMKDEQGNQLVGLKRFEFNPNLQRMSLIGMSLERPELKRVYAKGAPEVLSKLCAPSSIPADFEECLSRYTSCGYRVLAICYRDLSAQESSVRLDDLNRIDCEKELVFLGFTVFQNKAKPESKPTIEKLHKANVLMKMSTGDNPVTAAAVAKEVSMIPEHSTVLICDLFEEDYELFIDIHGLTNESARIKIPVPHFDQTITTKELTKEQSVAISSAVRELARQLPIDKDDEIAFTGRAFAYIYHAALLMEGRVSASILSKALLKSKVFARMQPNHKIKLIEMIQKTKRLVAMVGDGANDCGALRTADVGLALSQAEASISAPFNSKVLNISSFYEVLKEGRCTLATNFHNFKFMALYSMCQFSATTIAYTQITDLGNNQFLWQDLVINFPLFLVLGYTKPYDHLTSDLPGETLFSAVCLTSVLGAVVIETVGCIVVLFVLKAQDFYYASSNEASQGFVTTGQENAVVWLCASSLMIFSGLAFSEGKPFRKPFYTNIPFTFMMFLTFCDIWFLMISNVPRDVVFQIPDSIPGYFYAVTFGITVGFGIFMLIYERYLVNPIATCFQRCCHRKKKAVQLENDMDAPSEKDLKEDQMIVQLKA